MKKEFPVLYKYTSKGQAQQWQVVVEKNTFYTIEGIVDGKLTTSLPTVCTGKNIGKANETTPFQQAELEAKAKHQKKLDKGYNEKLTTEKKFFEPMLAFEYSKYPIDWEKEKYVFAQPKLDGLRAINNGKSIMSRNGKEYVSTPHLLHKYDVTFDGELYTHKFKNDFNKIVSLCKKTKPEEDDLKESAKLVEYWVYDHPSFSGTFSERYEALKKVKGLPKSFVIVPTVKITSQEQLDEYHAKNLEQGYEGTIIRRDNMDYENKRSKQLLKYKDFKDEEFTIVGYEEGTGNRVGTIGFFILQHDKNPNQTFKSNIKGDFEFLKQVWKDRESYIGATATVKYFQRTPKTEEGGDVPRFPYIIKLKREEYE